MTEVKRFVEDLINAWKKHRAPSFIKKHALRYDYVYDYINHDKIIVAIVKIDSEAYMLDLYYNYKEGYFDLEISELPAPPQELEYLDLWFIRPGKKIYSCRIGGEEE